MTQAVQHLKHEMSKIRTGRANPGILEPIMVGCSGKLAGQEMAGLKDLGARSRVGLVGFNGETTRRWLHCMTFSSTHRPTQSPSFPLLCLTDLLLTCPGT